MSVHEGTSTALLTDHYELTMFDAVVQGGLAERPAVFELFARSLPDGRRYGVVAGLDRFVDALERFTFGDAEIDWLAERGFLHDDTLDRLREHRFAGDVHGYREGEVYLPYSPVLTVTGTFAECVLLETLALSVFNFDSAVASAASRMVTAADGRDLLEFGSRRTHEEAAVAAARAAYVAGFGGTSNLEAGRRYGIPTLGTVAHAFVMIHDDEPTAFASQVAAHGAASTLLVDTYDTPEGIARAVQAAGTELGGVRIDSGDLGDEARRAREQLDALGATGTRIVLSGDLDEYAISELRDAPADAYGVGTRLVTGSGHPTASMVYKLVARGDEPGSAPTIAEAKTSGDKATVGHRKRARRRLVDGVAVAEELSRWDDPAPSEGELRDLQVEVVRSGEPVHRPSLDEIREHHRRALAELPPEAHEVTDGDPVLPTRRTGGLADRPPT